MSPPPAGPAAAIPATLPALLRARAQERANHPLLICDDEVLTYAEALDRSARLAKGLIASGVGHGANLGLLYPNGPEFVVAWLATARAGAVTVPLSTLSTAAELKALLRNADIATLIAIPSYRRHEYTQSLREAVPELDFASAPPMHSLTTPALRTLAFDSPNGIVDSHWSLASVIEAGKEVDDNFLSAAEDAVKPSDRMVIIHTSGSTARPKGVIHQHGSLIRHLHNLNRIRRYEPADRLFCNAPFFWIGGFAYGLLGTLEAGATLVCSNSETAVGVLDVIERTRPTMCNGYAQSVAHLPKDPSFAGRDFSSLRRGNLYPIMPDNVRPADPELRHNLLGMTEAGSVCLVSEDESDQPEHRRGSFGQPVPGLEAKVIDPDTGARAPVRELGELCLRGPAMMEGYYGRERHEVFDPDGWYHTGDLFYFDEDGFYYFKGRRGDMIKTAGANVSPREVEAAILGETGLVAHVVGIDDPERGQLVVAAVRVPHGVTAPDPADLRSRLNSRLSSYKVPQSIVMIDDGEVPLMSSGKLDVPALKKRFRDL